MKLECRNHDNTVQEPQQYSAGMSCEGRKQSDTRRTYACNNTGVQ
jgi:hypothetical protein